VGSRTLQHPFINQNIMPTQEFSGLVVGTVLGDANINRRGTITIEHSKADASYVEWKYEKFRDLGVLAPKSQISQVVRTDKRTGTQTYSCRFFTKAVYKEERQLFYPEGMKRVPPNLGEMLDPLGLAVWFMDDGGKGGNTKHGLVIDVSGFVEEDQNLLQEVLLTKFHLKTTLQNYGTSRTGNQAKKIYIPKETGPAFYAIVDPYVIPSMRRKLDAYD
jgi:LAGLIDADG DNA endonuclease family